MILSPFFMRGRLFNGPIEEQHPNCFVSLGAKQTIPRRGEFGCVF